MKWFRRDKPESDRSSSDQVHVMNTRAHTVERVSARELAPGSVEVKVHGMIEGIDGSIWFDAKKLNRASHQCAPFSEEARDLLREIKSCLDEVYNLSLEDWEDGFRRDANAEREIAFWLQLARVYHRLTASRDVNAAARNDYFKLVFACLTYPREKVLKVFTPSVISVAEAQDIANAYGRTA